MIFSRKGSTIYLVYRNFFIKQIGLDIFIASFAACSKVGPDGIEIFPPLDNGHKPKIRKKRKKTIPKLLFEDLFCIFFRFVIRHKIIPQIYHIK